MNAAQRKPTGKTKAQSILGIIAALLGVAAAAAVTAVVIVWPGVLETADRPGKIRQIGGVLIWTALAGSIVRMAASGWRDTLAQPGNRISRAALAAGAAAAVIIFSLGAAMLLHPRMFQ